MSNQVNEFQLNKQPEASMICGMELIWTAFPTTAPMEFITTIK